MLHSGKIRQLLLALVATLFVWLVHTLSLEYTSSMQFSVKLSTDLDGYEESAVSNEPLMLHGTATGYRIMRNRGFGGKLTQLEIFVERKYLTKIAGHENMFRVNVSDIGDKVISALGDIASVDFFESEYLTFTLHKQDFRKVPVIATSSISYRSQYMPVRDMVLTPDSVLVYGSRSELEGVNEIHTAVIYHRGVRKNIQGYVALEKGNGNLRLSQDKVLYSINVSRYVEATEQKEIKVKNLPPDKSLVLFPPKVEVTYRFPFDRSARSNPELEFYVDYEDCTASAGTRVIPKMEESDAVIYSYRLKPVTVEFIVRDEEE